MRLLALRKLHPTIAALLNHPGTIGTVDAIGQFEAGPLANIQSEFRNKEAMLPLAFHSAVVLPSPGYVPMLLTSPSALLSARYATLEQLTRWLAETPQLQWNLFMNVIERTIQTQRRWDDVVRHGTVVVLSEDVSL